MAETRQGTNRRVNRWVILYRWRAGEYFWPHCDVHNQAIAYPTRKAAQPELYAVRGIFGKGNVYLQKYGPIS